MALTKLRFSGESGLSPVAVLRDGNGDVWDGTEIVTYVSVDKVSYGIALTEQSSSSYYETDIPTALPPGIYHVTYHADSTQDDNVVYQSVINWDGSSLVDELVTGSSKTDLANLAISHLGVGKEIANLDTDTSEAAQACRRFYEIALYDTLREFPWPFALRISTLSLVEEDPTTEWAFAYRYPVNSLYAVRLPSGSRVDTLNSRIPFRIVGDDSGKLIYTDLEDAEFEYVAKVSNPLRFSPDFSLAFSYKLAVLIAPRIVRGDTKLRKETQELYEEKIMMAQATAANEGRKELEPDSEYINVRS